MLLAGRCLHSLYTFHPLTCMSYMEHDSLIVTGSGTVLAFLVPWFTQFSFMSVATLKYVYTTTITILTALSR